ncbi:MAG: hypothetical protein ACE5DU_03255, partial [Nitrosopumilus sp.]
AGRLYHILECLKNNRILYHSDQIYLENKLNSSFSVEEESVNESGDLPKIQQLIDAGKGDPGRLQHIYDMLANNKPLYHSDVAYLESKLDSCFQESKVEPIESPPPKTIKEFIPPPKETVKKHGLKLETKGTMPKGWNSENKSNEISKLTKNIEDETHKIQQQEQISNEIDLQRSKLSQLISHRKEYEQKITLEKSSLESQIKEERLRIETQTKLSEEIISQKEELSKVKKEREKIIKKIDSEKSIISKELTQQKKQLVQAQLEQEKIEKQVQTEQALLSKMALEQKSRLVEQAKMAHDIKTKQAELEKTKQDYDEIVSQVNAEKAKFAESENLKKLIKNQEQDLINAKEQRLKLINEISKEKEIISKKTQDEKNRLKSQTELNKQLKKEEKAFETLKKKHDKIEQQIKDKNQKLKKQQQKLKKQITEKNKNLKFIEKKSKAKKIPKKSTKTKK